MARPPGRTKRIAYARPLKQLRNIKCRRGHSRKDAFVRINIQGGIELICRQCLNERQHRYYHEGRGFRYLGQTKEGGR